MTQVLTIVVVIDQMKTDTKQLIAYEEAFLNHYKAYLERLELMAKGNRTLLTILYFFPVTKTCVRGLCILFLESIFHYSLSEIVHYNINCKSYNEEVNILLKL